MGNPIEGKDEARMIWEIARAYAMKMRRPELAESKPPTLLPVEPQQSRLKTALSSAQETEGMESEAKPVTSEAVPI